MFRAVDMAAEGAALLLDFAAVGQREDLETAAVGEQGALPAVELVQSAGGTQYLHAGAQVEVVCVAEDDFGVDLLAQFALVYGLDAAGGAHGHEDRGRDVAVVGVEHGGAGVAAGGV